MRRTLIAAPALLALLLAGCEEPPASAYYRSTAETQGTPIGTNTTGEECTMVRRGGGGREASASREASWWGSRILKVVPSPRPLSTETAPPL